MTTPRSPKMLALVVGAGASKEANLPAGSELKQRIAEALDIRFIDEFIDSRGATGDLLILRAFRELVRNSDQPGDINPLLEASWRIRDAMPQAVSIDNFIDSHRGDQLIATCGKLAIARCILAAEARSKLQFDRSNTNNKMNFRGLQDTWFNLFFRVLVEDCNQGDLAERFRKLVIITFNYDRCIEHFLHSSLQNYYGMTAKESAAVLTSLEIHHPYGKVGSLPWQGHRGAIEFGAEPSAAGLIELSKQLRTFTEGTDAEESEIAALRTSLGSAHRIVFLGFAFHRLNLELLLPGRTTGSSRTARPVFATALGISESDAQVIAQDLACRLDFDSINIRTDLTCSKLFSEYSRSMSLYQAGVALGPPASRAAGTPPGKGGKQ